ncbi:MAG: methyltransferase domain-containing protein [Anaerolineae bacterium]
MTVESRRPLQRLIQRVFAHVLARGGDFDRRYYGARRAHLLSSLDGRVLEIGPGAGTNLAYLPRDVEWIGVEPNEFMHPYIRRRAEEMGRDIDLRAAPAEVLDVPDASVDSVVGTLVLCSVEDQQRVLSEIIRVLKPGGRFIFIEHVASPPGSTRRWMQNVSQPVVTFFADGCHPNRETLRVIESAGFRDVQVERFSVPAWIVGPHISGIATR